MPTIEQLQQEINELNEVVEERNTKIQDLEDERDNLRRVIDEIYGLARTA